MFYLFLLILIIFFFLSYKIIRKLNINIFISILCTLLIIYILLNPQQCMDFTIQGVKLFFFSVFPSLFPFLVIINMIISFGGVNIYSKLLGNLICKPLGLPKNCSLVLIISVFCGYPLGARYASDLYEKNLIDFKTYERLLNIASNGSPLFIIGAVGTSMLSNSNIGYLLLISNIISCIFMSFILPNRYTRKEQNYISSATSNACTENLGVAFKNSIEDAIKTCLSIGGFITIFSVIINIIKSNAIFNIALYKLVHAFNISPEIIEGLSLGFIEITNGCNIISKSAINIDFKIILISFLIGFSGLSIISQVYSMVYKFNVSMKKYIFYKTIQGIINSIITFLLCKIYIFSFSKETFVSSIKYITITPSQIYILIILFISIPFIFNKLKNLFHTC